MKILGNVFSAKDLWALRTSSSWWNREVIMGYLPRPEGEDETMPPKTPNRKIHLYRKKSRHQSQTIEVIIPLSVLQKHLRKCCFAVKKARTTYHVLDICSPKQKEKSKKEVQNETKQCNKSIGGGNQ